MEKREVFWDYEVDLPSQMWQIGQRKLRVRTWAEVRGSQGDRGFMIRHVVKVLSHEVDPDDWGERKMVVEDA